MAALTILDYATDREKRILEAALEHTCSACGAGPGGWCFRGAVSGLWTMHGERVLAWGGTGKAETVGPL